MGAYYDKEAAKRELSALRKQGEQALLAATRDLVEVAKSEYRTAYKNDPARITGGTVADLAGTYYPNAYKWVAPGDGSGEIDMDLKDAGAQTDHAVREKQLAMIWGSARYAIESLRHDQRTRSGDTVAQDTFDTAKETGAVVADKLSRAGHEAASILKSGAGDILLYGFLALLLLEGGRRAIGRATG